MVKDDLKLLIPERNIVTVETFRNGKLRQRAKTHNMITRPGLDWLKYKRDYGLNTGIAAGKNTHKVPLDYFNTLVALKDSSAPTINENYNLSDVIAWANKTAYTGADTKRGTVNLVESYCTDNLIHWAIDFPTHAGNDGIINSIAWHYYDANTVMGNGTASLFYESLWGYNIKCYGTKWGDNKHIYIAESKTLAGTLNIYKISLATGAIVTTYGPYNKGATQNLNQFVIVGDRAYFNEYNGASYKNVYILNMTTGVFTTATRTAASTGLAYDGDNFWGVGVNSIIKYKADFSNDTVIAVPISGVYLTYDINNNCFYTSVGDNKYRLSTTGNILASFNIALIGNAPFYIINNKEYIDGGSGKFYSVSWESQGARALLPVPIQKTAADTMRINYDFDIRF